MYLQAIFRPSGAVVFRIRHTPRKAVTQSQGDDRGNGERGVAPVSPLAPQMTATAAPKAAAGAAPVDKPLTPCPCGRSLVWRYTLVGHSPILVCAGCRRHPAYCDCPEVSV